MVGSQLTPVWIDTVEIAMQRDVSCRTCIPAALPAANPCNKDTAGLAGSSSATTFTSHHAHQPPLTPLVVTWSSPSLLSRAYCMALAMLRSDRLCSREVTRPVAPPRAVRPDLENTRCTQRQWLRLGARIQQDMKFCWCGKKQHVVHSVCMCHTPHVITVVQLAASLNRPQHAGLYPRSLG